MQSGLLPFRSFKYLFFNVFWPFVLCLFAFFSLIFVFQFMNKADFFLKDTTSLKFVSQYFGLLSVSYLPLIIPFCLLFSVLFGYGRLSSSLELTAFSNLGYSKLKLSQPALLFSALAFIICSSSIHSWGPKSKLLSRSLHSVLINKAAVSALQAGVFMTQFPNMVLYAESEDNQKNLNRIFLLQKKNTDANFIFSNSGKFIKESPDQSIGLKLENGAIYNQASLKKTQESNFIISYKDYLIKLFKTSDFDLSKEQVANMTSKKLLKVKTPASRIEFHKRLVLSLSCLLFGVLALLFSLKLHERSSRGNGFFKALVFSLAFWVLLFISEYFSLQQQLPILIYIPICIFIGLIIWIHYSNKSKFVI